MKPSLIDKLQHLTERMEEVTALLASPDVTNNIDEYRLLTREHAELTPVVENYRQDT